MNKKKIMQKIIDGEIRMKPKWWFLAIDNSKKGAWIAALLTTATAILTIITYWEIYNPADLWELGEVGRELLFRDFPYFWFATGIAGIISSVILLRFIGTNYRRGTTTRIAIILLLIIVLTLTIISGSTLVF